MTTILVSGDHYATRDVWYDLIESMMIEQKPDTIFVEGEAPGIDTFCNEIALYYDYNLRRYPADWKKYGKGAGPIRNKEMLDRENVDVVWAFHDNIKKSKGTKNMIHQARERGIPVFIFDSDGKDYSKEMND
jgi:hypothetical protein